VKEDRSSDTALGVTVIRAVHQLLDDVPHILEDPVSVRFLGDDAVNRIRGASQRYLSTQSKGLRSHVVLRSRYAEDQLSQVTAAGIKQLVNLGAGYDTFAFRQPAWAGRLRIVEADHPATQSAKKELLRRVGIDSPGNVEFLPLDLEIDEMQSSLTRTTLNAALPTFVSCLGVLAYLKPETVSRVFESVARMPRGSVFVFAFAPSQGQAAGSAADRAAALGEPWLTRFVVEDLRLELQKIGFSSVSFLTQDEAKERYFKERHDLPAPLHVRLCRAVV
jgi:methyltransferase (TIGR00027 family)